MDTNGMRFLLLICLLLPAYAQSQGPEHAKQLVLEGNTLHDKGEFDAALARYRQAAAEDPSSYTPHFEMGNTPRAMKRLEESQSEFKRALELSGACWFCAMGLGQVIDDRGQHEEALQWFDKAAEIAPTRANPHYEKAIALVRLDRRNDAIEELKKAEGLEPKYPSPYFLLGHLYREQGKLLLASDQYLEAVKLEKGTERVKRVEELNRVQITMDSRVNDKDMTRAMAYCVVRAGNMTQESYHKRFPDAGTYVDNLDEYLDVITNFIKILDEQEDRSPIATSLRKAKAAGYLDAYVLAGHGATLRS